jgi:Protein of unknown function (DUF3047)
MKKYIHFAHRCAMMALLLLAFRVSAQAMQPPAFSALPISATAHIDGWRQVALPKKTFTHYQIVADPEGDHQTHVLQADAVNAASSLLAPLNVDPKLTPMLHWRWRTATILKGGDVLTKAGDDYPLRVYVVFDVPLDSLSFGARTKIRFARTLFGADVPVAALCYVWDAKQAVGTNVWNAFTDRLRMIVLQSGAHKQNQWVQENRDVAADFKAAFGFDAPKITAILVGADTDNTKETSRSWFGDLSFSAKHAEK